MINTKNLNYLDMKIAGYWNGDSAGQEPIGTFSRICNKVYRYTIGRITSSFTTYITTVLKDIKNKNLSSSNSIELSERMKAKAFQVMSNRGDRVGEAVKFHFSSGTLNARISKWAKNADGDAYVAASRIITAHTKNNEELHLLDLGLTTLPEEIRGLTKLKKLYLNDNQFQEMPNVDKLYSLEELSIENNPLSLSVELIEDKIKNLQSLKVLNLTRNTSEHNPSYPQQIGDLKSGATPGMYTRST